ncbi:hypothetical protein [Actinosynnema sp. NPDC020468]|uniref:hypothetical protein n=1 Tax=Actinosynnema sp. NPDC020468 TaxID=3154488 RepID=UPI0033F2CEBA
MSGVDVRPPELPPSELVTHPGCAECLDTVGWLLSVDRAHRRTGDVTAYGLSWVFDHFRWGPTRWPAAWCDLPTAEFVDCGVLAHLCAVVLGARGVACDRLQLVEPATAAQTRLWRGRWESAGSGTDWILTDHFVYHESLTLHTASGPRDFDTTELREIDPHDEVVWIRRWPGDWVGV